MDTLKTDRIIPRRILLQGNRPYATTFIGLADKFLFMVQQEAKARLLKHFNAAREIAPGVHVRITVTRHLVGDRFFRNAVVCINATVPTPKKMAGQIRHFMCLCGSCFTLGIVDSRTEANYSSEVRYTVLICSRDKANSNKRSYPNRHKPHTKLTKTPQDTVLVNPDFMMMVPAQSSDGALYEVGELVTLIPHPFGIDGQHYQNAPFMQGCSPPQPGGNQLYGACDIDATIGAVIVPIEIKGVAEYYQGQGGTPLRAPNNDYGGSACPTHERLQIPQTWPFGTYKADDQMKYVDVYDTLARYHLAYATIEVADRNSRNVTIKFIDSGQEALAYTLVNREAKKVGGAWDMTPLDSANAGHIYTAAPLPGDNQDIYIGPQGSSRFRHNNTIAVILVCPDQKVVLSVGRKTTTDFYFEFPVRHETICLCAASADRYYDVSTKTMYQHAQGIVLTKRNMIGHNDPPITFLPGTYADIHVPGTAEYSIEMFDDYNRNLHWDWDLSIFLSASSGFRMFLPAEVTTWGWWVYLSTLTFLSYKVRQPYTGADEDEPPLMQVADMSYTQVGHKVQPQGGWSGNWVSVAGGTLTVETIASFTISSSVFGGATVGITADGSINTTTSGELGTWNSTCSGVAFGVAYILNGEFYYFSPTRPQIAITHERLEVSGERELSRNDFFIAAMKFTYKIFPTSNPYDLSFKQNKGIKHAIPNSLLPLAIQTGTPDEIAHRFEPWNVSALIANEITLKDVVV